MRQPVIDTLQLSDALQGTGMERTQADSLARTLGQELREHVAVQSDLDAGFQSVRSEFTQVRSEVAQVRAEVKVLEATFQTKFNYVLVGSGLILSTVVGFGVVDRLAPAVAPVSGGAPAAGAERIPQATSDPGTPDPR